MKKFALLFVSLFAISALTNAQAVLRITEVMSSGGTADWIEISNIGDVDADITGYKFDDGSFSFAASLALNGITTIASGESVIFGESGSVTFATDFRTFWGIDETVQVGTYTGSGIGLSSSGDGAILFDAAGTEITRVSFGAATAGSSFFWGYNADGSFDTNNVGALNVGLLSSLGTNAGQTTFTSANAAANIGSPSTNTLTFVSIEGCTDALACNYDANANTSNGSCTFATLWYADLDNDGFGNASISIEACEAPVGYVANSTDCDDTVNSTNPDALEICNNSVDDNCDTNIDEGCVILRITEAMSSGGTADWIEITNLGSATADITGFKIDDGSFSFATSLALNGITSIASGESVIFGESGSATFATDFRTFWGIDETVQVGTYTGSGIGLSSSGDGVILFNGAGTEITRVSFGAATAGTSFFWGYNADGSFDTNNVGALNVGLLSSLGNNAGQVTFTSADAAANIASPGDAILAGFPIEGCTDNTACNYDALATINDGSCTYAITWYIDNDGDGYGTTSSTQVACAQPSGYAANDTDCNDSNNAVNPSASEVCYNGLDENCNGTINDNCAFGNISIASASNFVTVNENAGTVTVPVTMANATSNQTTVTFTLSVYSDATENVDYTWTNTLVIPASSNGVFNANISIIDDAIAEKAERIIVKLGSADFATIDAINNYRIIFIKDNDYSVPSPTNELNINLLASFSNGTAGTNSAEIVTYDNSTQRLYIANSIGGKLDIVNFSNPSSPILLSSISVAPYGNINSVVAHNGIVAMAIENSSPQSNGFVVFLDGDGNFINQVTAGAMPDMITFNKDYTKVLTANEGEPNSTYSIDPEGSVTIVDISGGVASITQSNVTQISLSSFNGQEATLRSQGIRIFATSASAAQDLEPEYIAIADDNTKAFVTMQENNAILVVDLTTNTIETLRPIGFGNYDAASGNALDASDQSGDVLITGNLPIKATYMPDAMSYATVNGTGLLFSANEGDSREFGSVIDANRISSSAFNSLDPTAFPDQAILRNNKFLGRLNALKFSGDTDGDGDYDELHAMGGRSFSIWNATTGALVFDSKDLLEQITASSSISAAFFNASNTTGAAVLKNRSDDKGPEPEGITTAVIGGKHYAFVSMERVGGLMIFNIENPSNPVFVGYNNNRTLNGSGPDLGAEGIIHISAANSPNGKEIIILANEVSSTLSIFEINSCSDLIDAVVSVDESVVCPGTPANLTITAEAGSSYQWYKDGSPIDGEVVSTYSTDASGVYSVEASNATFGCSVFSNQVTVENFTSSIVITQQPVKAVVCGNVSEVTFSVATADTVKTYQWQVKLNPNTSVWTALTNDATYSGVNTSELTVANPSILLNNRVFRCKMTNCGLPTYSTNGKLVIVEPVVITSQPTAQNSCLGGTVSFSTSATGAGLLLAQANNPVKYRWQRFNGVSFVDISNNNHYTGANTATLNIINVNSNDALTTYRCKVTGYCSPSGLFTDAVGLTIDNCTQSMILKSNITETLETTEWDFNVMPNPVINDITQISLAGQEGFAVVSIYDAIGKLVNQASIEMIENEVYSVDFTIAENGIYFLEILINGDRKVKKVIVSKQ
jgi:uncharacterized cupin superfamily protein